jgi:hypothetical protein
LTGTIRQQAGSYKDKTWLFPFGSLPASESLPVVMYVCGHHSPAGWLLIWIDLSIDELYLFSGFFCFLFTWSVTVVQGLQGCLGDGGSL